MVSGLGYFTLWKIWDVVLSRLTSRSRSLWRVLARVSCKSPLANWALGVGILRLVGLEHCAPDRLQHSHDSPDGSLSFSCASCVALFVGYNVVPPFSDTKTGIIDEVKQPLPGQQTMHHYPL